MYKTLNFVAIDFETANADMSSICQLGLVHVEEGIFKQEWKTYIDPEDLFDDINVSIHGIDENTVKGAPKLPDIVNSIYNYLDARITVCHTHFDRVALHKACAKYGLRVPTCTWLDSARVSRRTWEQCAYRGYGLGNVCGMLGYQFVQHDALEDAKAAAHILLAAIEKTGIDLPKWLKHVERRIGFPNNSDNSYNISQDGNPDGAFYGENLVFTGSLQIPRRLAADMAAKIGFTVIDGVNKKTTILVVGDQDVKKLAGHEKSSKHRKVEKLIAEGAQIRILLESDFKELVLLAETK
jgi:DNA polymerase-3 subunit epsilon